MAWKTGHTTVSFQYPVPLLLTGPGTIHQTRIHKPHYRTLAAESRGRTSCCAGIAGPTSDRVAYGYLFGERPAQHSGGLVQGPDRLHPKLATVSLEEYPQRASAGVLGLPNESP